jgi:hypothetical protein
MFLKKLLKDLKFCEIKKSNFGKKSNNFGAIVADGIMPRGTIINPYYQGPRKYMRNINIGLVEPNGQPPGSNYDVHFIWGGDNKYKGTSDRNSPHITVHLVNERKFHYSGRSQTPGFGNLRPELRDALIREYNKIFTEAAMRLRFPENIVNYDRIPLGRGNQSYARHFTSQQPFIRN